MDTTSEPGTVYAELDHSGNSHSLFKGVGTGSVGSHKIFAFSAHPDLCEKDVERCSENDLEELNEHSVLIQTGQSRNDSLAERLSRFV